MSRPIRFGGRRVTALLAREGRDEVESLRRPRTAGSGVLQLAPRDPNGYVLAFAQPA